MCKQCNTKGHATGCPIGYRNKQLHGSKTTKNKRGRVGRSVERMGCDATEAGATESL